jgi:hypothetical protein
VTINWRYSPPWRIDQPKPGLAAAGGARRERVAIVFVFLAQGRIEMTRTASLFIAGLIVVSSTSFAVGLFEGTEEDRAACRPDVERLCYMISPNAGPFAFLGCLKANRPALSDACRAVLEKYGQ